MDESTTKEIKMESLAEYEMSEENEGVPAWAVEMFGKVSYIVFLFLYSFSVVMV